MSFALGPQQALTAVNPTTGEFAICTDGSTVWIAWVTPTGAVNVIKSPHQGYEINAATPVTIETNASNGAAMLNEPFVVDPITNRLHLIWDRNEGQASLPCVLVYSHSDDGGATWSAVTTLDDGTVHGNNRFYRATILAYNGVVEVIITSNSSSNFAVDAVYSVKSTNGGNTFTAPAIFQNVPGHEPNSVVGEDGTAHVAWDDPSDGIASGGDLFYRKGIWSASGFVWANLFQLTTGQTCGRPRVGSSNGVVMLIANTNWGGNAADVSTMRSADNGATWGPLTRQFTHSTVWSSHPWISLKGGAAWWTHSVLDSINPTTYPLLASSDGGQTFNTVSANCFTTTSTSSDAPHLILTNDIAIMAGFDGTNRGYVKIPVFAPDPALTAIAGNVLDNFNRSENPLSTNWSLQTPDVAGLQADGSKAIKVSALGGGNIRNGSEYTGQTWGANAEIFVTLVAGTYGVDGGSAGVGLFFDLESNQSKYALAIQDNGIFFNFTLAGVFQSSHSDTTVVAAAGDQYMLRLTPSWIIIYRLANGASQWKEYLRFTDNQLRTTLNAAIDMFSNNGNPAVDNFGGSTNAIPSNTVAPAAPTGSLSVGGVLTTANGTWASANNASPARFTYQWQTSPDGVVWTSVPNAALPFFTVVDATKRHRCQVTGVNIFGSATANSAAALPPVIGGPFTTASLPFFNY